jgi:hypothetical protein
VNFYTSRAPQVGWGRRFFPSESGLETKLTKRPAQCPLSIISPVSEKVSTTSRYFESHLFRYKSQIFVSSLGHRTMPRQSLCLIHLAPCILAKKKSIDMVELQYLWRWGDTENAVPRLLEIGIMVVHDVSPDYRARERLFHLTKDCGCHSNAP